MKPDTNAQADAWLDRARSQVQASKLGAHAEQIGRVEEVGDGIALVSGLRDVRLDERLRFGKGQFGFAQVLEHDRIGCVLLDEVDAVEAGDVVHGTGDVIRVPVGPGLLGRVVDPLGRPLDGKGPIVAEAQHPIERPAPEIVDRDLVVQPVQTGLVVVDALFALARLARYGLNDATTEKQRPLVLQFLARFRNPLIIILLLASAMSAATGDVPSFVIIAVIVLLSITLDFVQEVRAQNAIAALRRSVTVQATVRRDGTPTSLPMYGLVPGDIVELIAGDLVPADCRLLEGWVEDTCKNRSQDLTTPAPSGLGLLGQVWQYRFGQ